MTRAQERRRTGYAICRRHGNIRGWERAMWRDQQAREEADVAAFLAFAEEEERRLVRQEEQA